MRVIFDTETTGFGPEAEIVEIAIIDENGAVLLDTLIKPTIHIPAEASAIHGITDHMVVDAPTIRDVFDDILAAFDYNEVWAYNAEYDMRLLKQSVAARSGFIGFPEWNVNCAMLAYAAHKGDWNPKYRNYRWHSLTDAMRQLGLEWEGEAHRAMADTRATLAVLQSILPA